MRDFATTDDAFAPSLSAPGGSYGTLSTARMTAHVCASLVVFTVLTSRLALPYGSGQISLVLPVAVAHLLLITALTRFTVSLPRLLATIAMLGIVLFETALLHRHTSTLSLMFLMAVYLPLVVSSGLDDESLRRIWRVFIGLAMIAALLGVLQIAMQAFAGGYYPDPIQLLPETYVLQGYQTTYPIMRGVLPTMKANGMLFVEPSAFSQFVALALLGELWLFRRWKVLVLLATGLALSFSGTGLLMLAIGVLLGAKPRAILTLGLAGAIVAGVLFATGYGEAFTSRADEIRRPGTSGYERFVSPFLAMGLPWQDSLDAVLWGYGAGRVEDLDTEFPANYSPVPKVFLEYGLVGLAAFTVLWLTMFTGLAVDRTITAALVVMYFLAAGSLLQPYTVFTLWGLTAGFCKRTPETGDLGPPEWDVGDGTPVHPA